jgi:hypothetical protein
MGSVFTVVTSKNVPTFTLWHFLLGMMWWSNCLVMQHESVNCSHSSTAQRRFFLPTLTSAISPTEQEMKLFIQFVPLPLPSGPPPPQNEQTFAFYQLACLVTWAMSVITFSKVQHLHNTTHTYDSLHFPFTLSTCSLAYQNIWSERTLSEGTLH